MHARTTLLWLAACALLAPTAMAQRTPVTVDADPPAETFRVEFEFTTYDYREKRPWPHVELEIGIGHPRDPQHHVDRQVLTHVTSDGNGSVRGAVDVSLDWKEDSAARIWARVATPGLSWTSAIRTLYPREDTKPTRLAVYAGGTVLGTVRSASGELVPDARVWLFFGDTQRLSVTRTVDGRFAAHVFEAGSYVLHARAAGPGPGYGSGTVEVNDVVLSGEARTVDVEVGGGIGMAGRVIDPDGNPVPGVRLLAVPTGHEARVSPFDTLQTERLGGLWGGQSATGPDGSFEFPHLLSGEYDFYAAWREFVGISRDPNDGFHPQMGKGEVFLGSVPFEGTAKPVELRFEARRVEVLVKTERGDAPEFFAHKVDGKRDRSFLELLPLSDPEYMRVAGSSRAYVRGQEPIVVDNLAVFPVHETPFGALLTWDGPAFPFTEKKIDDTSDSWRTRVELDLGARGEPARLTMQITDPLGNPHGELYGADARIEIRSATTGQHVASSEKMVLGGGTEIRGGAWSLTLAPGRYIVEADAEPRFGCVIPAELPRAAFAPTKAIVELGSGDERRIELQLEPAGYLDFESNAVRRTTPRVIAAGPLDGEPRFLDPMEEWSYRAREGLRLRNGGVPVTMTRPDGSTCDGLRFEASERRTGVPWIVPHSTVRCRTPIPPGRWTLRVADGERMFEREVEIRAGRTTVVRW